MLGSPALLSGGPLSGMQSSHHLGLGPKPVCPIVPVPAAPCQEEFVCAGSDFLMEYGRGEEGRLRCDGRGGPFSPAAGAGRIRRLPPSRRSFLGHASHSSLSVSGSPLIRPRSGPGASQAGPPRSPDVGRRRDCSRCPVIPIGDACEHHQVRLTPHTDQRPCGMDDDADLVPAAGAASPAASRRRDQQDLLRV